MRKKNKQTYSYSITRTRSTWHTGLLICCYMVFLLCGCTKQQQNMLPSRQPQEVEQPSAVQILPPVLPQCCIDCPDGGLGVWRNDGMCSLQIGNFIYHTVMPLHMPLHIAILRGHINCLKTIVAEEPASVHAIITIQVPNGNIYYSSPLFLAMNQSTVVLEIVLALLEQPNINPNVGSARADGSRSYTPLHYAIEKNYLAIVKALLQHSDINLNVVATSADGNAGTALHLAAKLGRWEAVRELIQHGNIKPNALMANSDGKYDITALHLAAEEDHWEAVRELLKHADIDPNARMAHTDAYRGKTALHLAAEKNHWKTVQELLKHPDIDPNAIMHMDDCSGITALHLAAERNHWEAVRELLRHDNTDPNLIKIDTNEMDDEINYDGTPLHFAAEKGYEKVVRELLQHWNINPNVVLVKRTDEVGFPCPTPLHLAALNCFPEVVRMLLEHTSINYRIKNKRGETALDMALDFAWDVYNTGGVGAIQTCRAFFDRTDCSVTICLKLLKRVLSSEGMKNFFENILDLLNCKPIATYLASRGNTEDMDRILVKLLDSGNIDDLENIFKMLNCKPIAIYLASKGKTEDIDRILRPIRPAITKKFPHVFNPKFSLQREIGHIYKGTVKHSAAYYEKRIHFLCTAWKNTQAKYGNLEKKYDNLEKKYDNLKKKMDSLGISEATLRKRKFPFPSHHDAFSKKEKKH